MQTSLFLEMFFLHQNLLDLARHFLPPQLHLHLGLPVFTPCVPVLLPYHLQRPLTLALRQLTDQSVVVLEQLPQSAR